MLFHQSVYTGKVLYMIASYPDNCSQRLLHLIRWAEKFNQKASHLLREASNHTAIAITLWRHKHSPLSTAI